MSVDAEVQALIDAALKPVTAVLISHEDRIAALEGASTPTPPKMTYDDVPLPPSLAVPTVTSAQLNDFIQGVADGQDATHHRRIIIPPTLTISPTIGLCGGGKNHITVWMHGPGSSAWRRGSSEVLPDPGTTIKPKVGTQPWSPKNSAFLFGSKQTGADTISYGAGGSDVVFRGARVVGPSSNPGMYPSANGNEVHAVVEFGTQKDCQLAYCMVEAMPGDLVRFRSSERGRVHHVYAKSVARMVGSFIVNPTPAVRADNILEDVTCDRAGYCAIDFETEDAGDGGTYDGGTVRRCIVGTYGFLFAAIEEMGKQKHMADVVIEDNIVDGWGFGTFGGRRDLLSRINDRLVTSAPTGQDPRMQRVRFNRNKGVLASSLTAKYVDGLEVKGNTNLSLVHTNCTGVVTA